MSELGETLKKTRRDKGISLEELQASTKIQKRYLEAVEKGKYDQLPGRFYARAFIKSYAEAVGLDPDELFDTYANEVPVTGDSVPEQMPSRTRRNRARPPRVSSSSKRKSSTSALLPKILAAVVIIGLFAVIWFAFQDKGKESGAEGGPQDSTTDIEFSQNPDAGQNSTNNDEGESSGQADNSEENKGQESSEKPKKPEEPKMPKQALTKTGKDGDVFHYTLKNTDQFKLKLSVVNGDSWIEVRKSGPDGKKYVYKMTKPGFSVTKNLSGTNQVFLKIGSTPHVEMYINGEPFVYPSDKIYQKFLITFQKTEM